MTVSAGEALEGVVRYEAEVAVLLDAGRKYAACAAWPAMKVGQQASDVNGGANGFMTIRVDPRYPCPTLAKVPVSVLGAYGPMHWSERRKFSVPELKRLSSFPDAFDFGCEREKASGQIGNCVLPLFMARVAEAVRRSIA